MNYTFEADLSVEGIKKLQKQLLDYASVTLPEKIDRFTRILAEKGVQIAKSRVMTYDAIFTQELLNSIVEEHEYSNKQESIYYITADSKHAAFVEFGTGQYGLNDPYPYKFPDGVNWEYNSGEKIIEIAPGEYGWFFILDGKWCFTKGMPSRPFLHETSTQLISIIQSTAKEVFG